MSTKLCSPLEVFRHARVENKSDARPLPGPKMSWRLFARSLEEPSLREDKDGPGWIPAVLGNKKNPRGNLRHNDNILALSAVVLDLDGPTHYTPDQITKACADRAKLLYAAHTTHSTTRENRRWRVILPLDCFLPPALFDAAKARAVEMTGLRMRDTRSEPARLYFLPSCPEGMRPYYCWICGLSGSPLPTGDLAGCPKSNVRDPKQASSPLPPFSLSPTNRGDPTPLEDREILRGPVVLPYSAYRLSRLYQPKGLGERHGKLLAYARALKRTGWGWGEDSLAAAFSLWWDKCRAFCVVGTKDRYFSKKEFLAAYKTCPESPKGLDVVRLRESGEDIVLPPRAESLAWNAREIMRACHYLQGLGDSFFLSNEDAGRLVGLGKWAGGRILRTLVQEGFLARLDKGDNLRGAASTYRVLSD